MYNYLEAVKDDVRTYIQDNITLGDWNGDRDNLEVILNDDLWVDDSVTGNGSGSYTFSRAQAKEYFLDGGECYLQDMCFDYGIDAEELGQKMIDGEWEWLDVSIRCYLLGRAISEVLDEFQKELEGD